MPSVVYLRLFQIWTKAYGKRIIGDCVAGKTIGIWSYGKIGKRIAQYKTFGAQVIVWGSENSEKKL
jgi:phosphoglycerate dehydrogenase-like enzyme